MTGLNHAVTGALVAAAINKPAIALPAALLSHFAIDTLPHWDYYKVAKTHASKLMFAMLDVALALIVLFIFVLTVDAPAGLIMLGGLLGILPDFMWLPFILRGKPSISTHKKSIINILRRYHMRIQWAETVKLRGLYAELIWFILTAILIFRIHS